MIAGTGWKIKAGDAAWRLARAGGWEARGMAGGEKDIRVTPGFLASLGMAGRGGRDDAPARTNSSGLNPRTACRDRAQLAAFSPVRVLS